MPPNTSSETRAWKRQLGLLIALGATLRAAYFLDYTALPFLDGPLGDSQVYLHQAASVLRGDLGDASLVAFSPLYGYLLALFGGEAHMVAVVLCQHVLGLLTLVLVADGARLRFGTGAGLAAGALLVGYGMTLFYESKILSDTLGLFLAALATWLSLREHRAANAFGAAAVMSLAVLARASMIFVLPLLVLAFAAPAQSRRDALRRVLAAIGGVALVLGAHAAWTKTHVGVAVPVIYTSSSVEIVGQSSSTEWRGSLRDVAGEASELLSPWDRVRRVERALREREPSRMSEALAQVDLSAYVAGALSKLPAGLSDIERTFQYGYYGERDAVPILDLLPISFLTLLALGLVGLVRCAWIERRGVAMFLPLLLGGLAAITLYHPSSRYRLDMVIPLAMLGGYALASIFEAKARRWALVVAPLLMFVAVLTALRGSFYELRNPAMWELTLADAYMTQGDRNRAEHHVARALELAEESGEVRSYADYVRGMRR